MMPRPATKESPLSALRLVRLEVPGYKDFSSFSSFADDLRTAAELAMAIDGIQSGGLDEWPSAENRNVVLGALTSTLERDLKELHRIAEILAKAEDAGRGGTAVA